MNRSESTYRRAKPKITEIFERMLKIMEEHLKRHEEAMFPEGEGSKFNPKLAADANKLATSFKSLGDTWLKIQSAAKKEADLMTFEEELSGVIQWIEFDLGRNHQHAAIRQLLEMIYRLEAKHGKHHYKASGSPE